MKLKHLFENNGINIKGIHYSNNSNLITLDPSKHGTGILGAERKRARDYPKLFNKDRIYFYTDGGKKEPGLGNNKYEANLLRVYDMISDKDNLGKKAKEKSQEISGMVDNNLTATLFENLILEKGYNGYFNKKAKIIVYFKKIDVKKAD